MKRILRKACLMTAGLTTMLLSGAAANAHNVSSKVRKWTPPSASIDLSSGHIVSSFCDGKYEDVAGELFYYGLGNSIDFYRFNSGLPKLEVKSEGLRYGRHTRRETRLRDALRLMDRSQSHLSPEAVGDYIMTLNVNLHNGKDPNWWIQPEPSKKVEPSEKAEPNEKAKQSEKVDREQGCTIWLGNNWNGTSCRHYYRQGQSVAAKIAQENTAFDWLMTGHQLDNVRSNWLGYAKLNKDSVANIFEHIDKQSQNRPGINIWMTQYQHHKLFEHVIPSEIARRAQDAVTRIITCQATPAEYGIIAVGDLGLPREYLPKGLAESRTRRDIHRLTLKAISEGDGLDAAYHARLRVLEAQLEDKAWATHFLFLSAPDVATAVEIYQNSLLLKQQAAYRYDEYYGGASTGLKGLIFSLPTESIPHTLMQFGQALSENKLDFVASLESDVFPLARATRKAAHAEVQRRFEHYSKHRSYSTGLEDLKRKLDIETAKLAQLDTIENSDLPLQVRASLLAILAEASHTDDRHPRRHPKNIYPEQSGSEFLDVYLRHKLFPGIIFSPRIRGYPPHGNPRLYLENRSYPTAFGELPPLRKNDETPEVGLAALVDWEKLDAFAGESKLTLTLTANIIEWLDSASAEDRRANADLMAPALYSIIRMARYEEAGTFRGASVQKIAHEYLHKYYGQTSSAKTTPYWWPSWRRGHVPF